MSFPGEMMLIYGLALACVFGLSAGQILFKLAATAWAAEQTLWAPRPLSLVITALTLYGVTTLAWIWILRQSELGRIYPLMSLAFVLVPLGSMAFLGERFGNLYYAGVGLIIVGLLLTLKAAPP